MSAGDDHEFWDAALRGDYDAMDRDTETERDTLSAVTEPDTGSSSGGTWVTLREAEHRTGVAVSTLRKWRRRDEIPSRMEPGPTGDRVIVPLEAVEALAAKRGAGRFTALPPNIAEHGATAAEYQPAEGRPESDPTVTPTEPEEPPRLAIELLARADARAEYLLDRLAQAERERADAERDVAIERHRREHAEQEAERLRAELSTVRNPKRPTGGAEREEPQSVRWWERWRKRT